MFGPVGGWAGRCGEAGRVEACAYENGEGLALAREGRFVEWAGFQHSP